MSSGFIDDICPQRYTEGGGEEWWGDCMRQGDIRVRMFWKDIRSGIYIRRNPKKNADEDTKSQS